MLYFRNTCVEYAHVLFLLVRQKHILRYTTSIDVKTFHWGNCDSHSKQ